MCSHFVRSDVSHLCCVSLASPLLASALRLARSTALMQQSERAEEAETTATTTHTRRRKAKTTRGSDCMKRIAQLGWPGYVSTRRRANNIAIRVIKIELHNLNRYINWQLFSLASTYGLCEGSIALHWKKLAVSYITLMAYWMVSIFLLITPIDLFSNVTARRAITLYSEPHSYSSKC